MGNSASDQIKKYQNTYINKSFGTGDGSKTSEVIDIVSSYPWMANETLSASSNNSSGGISKNNNLPFCYAIERKSAANAGIANIFNLIQSTGSQISKATSTITNIISNVSEGAADMVEGGVANATTQISEIFNKLAANSSIKELLASNNLNDDIFMPYKYLYITKNTGKMFVFPLTTNDSTFSPIKNSWAKGKGLPAFLQKTIDKWASVTGIVSGASNLINDANAIIEGKGGDTGNIEELAKSYAYPQNGDKLNVQFVLYNTTKVDAWKLNYKFLYLFILRNLPLRIDSMSFVPPLLYDVTIPGVKRMPVCGVEGIKVQPRGLMRTLTCDNFLKGSGKLVVNVPEAWDITITFSSLIAPSANMMLSGIMGALNISTETTDAPPNK